MKKSRNRIIICILVILMLILALFITPAGDEIIINILNNDTETNENSLDNSSGENNSNSGYEQIQPKEASYEEWLAAEMVIAISLSYVDFELEEAYVASETQLNSHDESEGAYVKFKSGGETIVIHSRPLDEERSEKGTIDFHSQTLGFATFDVVGDVSSEEGVKSIDLNSLNELISKSMLVSLYEHY